MKEKLNLTDDILQEEVSKVDLRESTSKECPKCHHMIAPHHPICIYCGQVIDNSIFT
jgi:ribosomal protein L32